MEGESLAEIERRILRFFQEHPQAVETPRGIATWLGAEESAVQQALEGLVARGWLVVHETTCVRAYSMTRDERLLAKIHEVLGAGDAPAG